MLIRRHRRLRPTSAVGTQAIGMAAWTKSGCASARTKMCMQPIEVPITSRRRSTFNPSVATRRSASTMSA